MNPLNEKVIIINSLKAPFAQPLDGSVKLTIT